jgi:hypothetical protein
MGPSQSLRESNLAWLDKSQIRPEGLAVGPPDDMQFIPRLLVFLLVPLVWPDLL